MATFELHPQLAKDCFVIAESDLNLLLLLNDSRYPWCLLVPKVPAVTEIFQLNTAQQEQLMHESSLLAQTMQTLFNADKMNIAALGNVVPQLHVHHIARFIGDDAWPGPVWGVFPAIAYDGENNVLANKIITALNAESETPTFHACN